MLFFTKFSSNNKVMINVDNCLKAGPLFVVLKVAYEGKMEDYLVVPIKPIFLNSSMEANKVRT